MKKLLLCFCGILYTVIAIGDETVKCPSLDQIKFSDGQYTSDAPHGPWLMLKVSGMPQNLHGLRLDHVTGASTTKFLRNNQIFNGEWAYSSDSNFKIICTYSASGGKRLSLGSRLNLGSSNIKTSATVLNNHTWVNISAPNPNGDFLSYCIPTKDNACTLKIYTKDINSPLACPSISQIKFSDGQYTSDAPQGPWLTLNISGIPQNLYGLHLEYVTGASTTKFLQDNRIFDGEWAHSSDSNFKIICTYSASDGKRLSLGSRSKANIMVLNKHVWLNSAVPNPNGDYLSYCIPAKDHDCELEELDINATRSKPVLQK